MEFWFEFASTYSYPAAMLIEERARAAGVPIEWKPFLLGPLFAAQGLDDSPFNLFPIKGRYMWRDLERLCAQHGLPFRKPSVFPKNGLLACRIALLGSAEPWGPAFVRAVYQANFAHDLDISQPTVLTPILESLDLPASTLLTQASDPELKARLREQTETAKQRGIFGAPSFVVGDELFWGQDRLDTALAWARSPRAHTPASE